MAVIRHCCIVLACDVCGAKLTDEESGGIPHFDSPAEAHRFGFGNGDGWILGGDGFALCDAADDGHRDALAAQLPDFGPPVLDGQDEIPFPNPPAVPGAVSAP
jgi:hypothetical protein